MRVLIVDDNLLVRTLLRAIVTEAGHEVVGEADNGADGMREYEALRPDLVTLDLVMPGENGLTVLFDLKRLDPDACVVVCSAHLTERRVLTAIELGASGFIVKPFDRKRVLESLDAAVVNRGSAPVAMPDLPPLAEESERERREFERVSASLPVILIPAGKKPVRTVTNDISGNGFAISNAPLQIGESARFSLRLGPEGGRVMGHVRAVRSVPPQGQAFAIEDVSVVDHERMISYILGRLREPLEPELSAN